MAKILVTGGPVHTMLDSVKMVTNRFKGGRMKALAEELGKRGHNVLYLTARHLVEKPGPSWDHMGWGGHEGFEDYRDTVLKVAPEMDMVILGAAVANLIPRPPWDIKGKFPSHDYQEGDIVNVPFEVAKIEMYQSEDNTTFVSGLDLKTIETHEVKGRGNVHICQWPEDVEPFPVTGKVVILDGDLYEVRSVESMGGIKRGKNFGLLARPFKKMTSEDIQ